MGALDVGADHGASLIERLRSFSAMAQFRELDDEILGDLERLLAEQPGDIPAELLPGRDRDELSGRLTQAGFSPPEEAMSWWSWHDGAASRLFVLPGLEHDSVETALAGYTYWREQAQNMASYPDTVPELADPDRWWHAEWLPVFGAGGRAPLLLDGRAPSGVPAVRQVDWSLVGDDAFPTRVAASLGELVEVLMRACRDGQFKFDADRRIWRPADGQWRAPVEIVAEYS